MTRILRIAWGRWLKIAEALGNIQMTILLSLIYWTFVLILAVPIKVLSDRLGLRHTGRAHWVDRSPEVDQLESMRKQG